MSRHLQEEDMDENSDPSPTYLATSQEKESSSCSNSLPEGSRGSTTPHTHTKHTANKPSKSSGATNHSRDAKRTYGDFAEDDEGKGFFKYPLHSALARSGSDSFSFGRSITWDEATIEAHDRERGSRMTIPESKTPHPSTSMFEASDAEEYDQSHSGLDCSDRKNSFESLPKWEGVNINSLVSKLQEQVTNGYDFDNEMRNEELRRPSSYQSLKAKRKEHYNEFRVVQQLRSTGKLLLDEEDQEDEDDLDMKPESLKEEFDEDSQLDESPLQEDEVKASNR